MIYHIWYYIVGVPVVLTQPFRDWCATVFAGGQVPFDRAGPRQHDAHEFFCTLVGAVADEKPKNGNNNKEAKDDSGEEGQHGQTPSGEAAAQNFQGQICSTFLCWKCCLDLRIGKRLNNDSNQPRSNTLWRKNFLWTIIISELRAFARAESCLFFFLALFSQHQLGG